MKKPIVICDTNIWYGLRSGDIDSEKIKHVELIGTILSVRELASTFNMIKDINRVKEVIRVMMTSAKNVIPSHPLHHIFLLDNPHIEEKISEPTDTILTFTEEIANGRVLNSSEMNYLKQYVESVNLEKKKLTELLNSVLMGVKQKIPYKTIHKQNREKANVKETTKQLILSFLSGYLETEYIVKRKFFWHQIDLLTNVIHDYFLELEISQRKFDSGDLFDMFNMAYVQPGMLYWTNEEKWQRIIKSNKKISHYLFEVGTPS